MLKPIEFVAVRVPIIIPCACVCMIVVNNLYDSAVFNRSM